jgi:glycolate oxidase
VRELGSSSELDLAVPRSELAALVRGVRRLAAEAGLSTAAFGNAADGNLHVHVYREGKGDDDEARFAAATRAISAEACRLGGTATGGHGVGAAARDVLSLSLAPPVLAAMRAVKDALDPLGILNPGKVFP